MRRDASRRGPSYYCTFQVQFISVQFSSFLCGTRNGGPVLRDRWRPGPQGVTDSPQDELAADRAKAIGSRKSDADWPAEAVGRWKMACKLGGWASDAFQNKPRCATRTCPRRPASPAHAVCAKRWGALSARRAPWQVRYPTLPYPTLVTHGMWGNLNLPYPGASLALHRSPVWCTAACRAGSWPSPGRWLSWREDPQSCRGPIACQEASLACCLTRWCHQSHSAVPHRVMGRPFATQPFLCSGRRGRQGRAPAVGQVEFSGRRAAFLGSRHTLSDMTRSHE